MNERMKFISTHKQKKQQKITIVLVMSYYKMLSTHHHVKLETPCTRLATRSFTQLGAHTHTHAQVRILYSSIFT